MKIRRAAKAEVTTDRRTVWVNGSDGMCIGRFGLLGIDVHRDFAAQARGEPECLACTHERPGLSEWRRFQVLMRRHYGVGIGDDLMPDFLCGEVAP